MPQPYEQPSIIALILIQDVIDLLELGRVKLLVEGSQSEFASSRDSCSSSSSLSSSSSSSAEAAAVAVEVAEAVHHFLG